MSHQQPADLSSVTARLIKAGVAEHMLPDLARNLHFHGPSCRCPGGAIPPGFAMWVTADHDLGRRRVIVWAARNDIQLGGQEAAPGLTFPYGRGPVLDNAKLAVIEQLAQEWEAEFDRPRV